MSAVPTNTRQPRTSRSYVVLGFAYLLIEIFLALKFHWIVTQHESLSIPFQEQHQHQQQQHYQSKSSNSNIGHRKIKKTIPPDGRFNGFPVFYHDLTLNKSYHSRPYSSVRCVGENYQGSDFSWMHRSCHFRFLCFNVSSREFEVYARPDDEILQSIVSRRQPFVDISSGVLLQPRNETQNGIDSGVSLASGTVRHPRDRVGSAAGDDDTSRGQSKEAYKWFPTVIRSSPPERYYALDEDMILVPFHTMLKEEGPREKEYSVLWDDLFPVYTLLNMFQLVPGENQKEVILMRYISKMENRADGNQVQFQRKMDEFRPLMMRRGRVDDEKVIQDKRNSFENTYWTTQLDSILMPTPNTPILSHLVCAKDGLAGLGPHGIQKAEGKHTANLLPKYGKGGLLWLFRNYCLRNLGLIRASLTLSARGSYYEMTNIETSNSIVRIIFSAPAYGIASRIYGKTDDPQIGHDGQDSTPIITELRDFLVSPAIRSKSENGDRSSVASTNSSRVHIESHDFSKEFTSLTDRVELMMGTTVFIATCSEAVASMAIFLPRGATLIVFYETKNQYPEHENSREGKGFVTSDRPTSPNCAVYRDLLNNLSHVRVQWLPITLGDTRVLLNLVEHELKVNGKKKSDGNS